MTASSEAATGERGSIDDVSVLLVDDDEQWAWVTGQLLEREADFTVELAHSLAAGRDRFAELAPDCVVCDYHLGDGDGLGLLATVRETDPDLPFVLITGKGDEGVASDAITRGVTDYIRKGEDDAGDVLRRRIENAVRSRRAERALERHRRTKTAALDVLRETSTEADLSREFCRELVANDAYDLAWIGAPGEGGTLRPRTSAGTDDYLVAVTEDATLPAREPAVRAFERGEAVVARDLSAGDADWAAIAVEQGFEVAVAAPIRYEGVTAGVLAVYLSSRAGLGDGDVGVIEEYAESVGYALRSLDRKRSLLSGHQVRVDVSVADGTVPLVALADAFDGSVRPSCPAVVTRSDGTTRYLIDVEGADADAVREAAARVPSLDLDEVDDERSPTRCALVASGTTPEELLGEFGARFERTVVEDGAAAISVRVGTDRPIDRLAGALEGHYEDVTVRTVWTESDRRGRVEHPFGDLTDKQREALTHSFYEGYFERPRGANATEIAAHLGITRQTLAQHLRAAQRKVFAELIGDDDRR